MPTINDLRLEGLSAPQNLGIGGSGGALGGAAGAPKEADVLREMQTQGMDVPKGDAAQSASTFSDILRSSVSQVNEYQTQADTAIKELVAGRTKNIHETMLAIERADASLKLMMQVRNKVLDAYKEIMR